MPLTSMRLSTAMEVVKEDDLDGHKLIWTFASDNMPPDGVPPMSALVYGARRILLPEMHWESTPDLLDILALSELVRRQTLQDASEALEWDQYYRKAGKDTADGIPLEDKESKRLRSIVKNAGAGGVRSVYRAVIMQLCWAHIHLLRRSRETYLIKHYFDRYFPRSVALKGMKHPSLWLGDLSKLETTEYDNIRQKLKDFLQDAEDWEQEYFKDLPDTNDVHQEARISPEYQSQFCKKFTLLLEWDKLVAVVLRHLKKVQNLESALHSIFPDEESASEVGVMPPGSDVSPILRTPQNRANFIPSTHPRQGLIRFETASQDTEKKESQESNMSSKLSYVDAPSDVTHVLPTSLLPKMRWTK